MSTTTGFVGVAWSTTNRVSILPDAKSVVAAWIALIVELPAPTIFM